MATKKSQPKLPVKTNENGKPILNKNSIKQSEKPRNKPISLPDAGEILPKMADYEELQVKLDRKIDEYLVLERQLSSVANKLQDAEAKLVKYSTALKRLGVGLQ